MSCAADLASTRAFRRLIVLPAYLLQRTPCMVQWPGANPPAPARRRGQPHLPPATGYAIEPTAPTSRRPHAHDAVAGPRVRRVARMVQEPSLQAAGPPRATCSAGQAGVGWRSIGRSPTAISLKNTGGGDLRGRPILADRAMTVSDDADAVFFRAVARDRHPTPACTGTCGRRRPCRLGKCALGDQLM